MTDLTEMWDALAAHQHIADHKGYGKAWARMCSERTAAAARTAARTADDTDDVAAARTAARTAAAAADDAARTAADASKYAKEAIAYITKANDGLAYIRDKLTEGEKV